MNHPHKAIFVSIAHAIFPQTFDGFRNPVSKIVLAALLLGFVQPANAQVPDLTAGDLPPNAGVWFNLGPTGVQAWVYRGIEGNASSDTGLSRQIQVKSVEAGSPAAGILQVDDVILGVNGTGGAPALFTDDARKSFAYAIADAEARNPATLALLVWRAGTTSTLTLTLRTMGAYSATAPFNCPKSAKILDEGLDYAMANQDAGYAGISALALMAADNPADPKNAARQARAQTYALAQMLSPAQIKYIKDGNVELGAKIAWERGLRLVTLTEYYLKTGDAQVLPSIDAIALSIAHGQGANGAVGHLFNTSIKKGTYNEPFGRGYTMNASTLPSALGLVLARKCGVTLPELEPAIERVTRTLAGNAGLGTFNYYVEGEPGLYNEDNGKSALGAIVFAMHDNRVKEAKFMSNLAIGGAHTREDGHITHYFGLLWGPLGCQVGGQAAAVAHFNEIRWQLDLNRWWDGGFEYERFSSTGSTKTPSMNSGAKFWMSTAALLTYAMPLQQLEITGKTFATRPELILNNSEISAAVLSNNYDPASRTTAELMQDLQSDVTGLAVNAAKELAKRPTEATAQVETLIARAADPVGTGRSGACRALGEIRDDRAVPTLLGLLSDPNEDLRYLSAEALAKFPIALLKENVNTLLQIAAANAKPAYPLDFDDAQQLAQMKLGEVIFGYYGTSGALGGDLSGIDRAILYPAIRAFSTHPHGVARNRVAALYNKLTPADVTALSDALIDGVNFFGLASMTQTPGLEGIKVLERDNWAEGIPLAKDYVINSRFKNIATGLTELQDYGSAALTVTPNPQVIDFLNSMLVGEYESQTDDTYNAQIIAIRDALLAASNPPVLPSFKSIQSITASPAVLTLPAKQTQLNVSFTDLSQGDTVFSWRKVHGPGNVTFSTNDSGGSISPQVYFQDVPGLYLFEVKAWDARNLTEVTGTVQVELRDSGGNLPANSPPTANAQSVTVAQAIPSSITLTGNDPEGYPFASFEVLSGPGNGTLGGSPPFLTYTSKFNFTGADSLSFRVRDSNGQWSTPATVSITVATRVNPVGLVIYEPVNYPIGNLNGKSGTSEIGFTGTWAANTSGTYPVTVLSTSLAYGGLPTAGGSLSNVAYTSRALSPALASSGLLNDGATLWFSVLIGSDTSGKLRWALANNSFDSTTSVIKDEGAQLGRGVGFYMSSGSAPWTTTVYAATFTDASTTNDTGDPMFLSEAIADTGILAGQGQTRLLVGKFTWGAAQDSIQLYLPTPDMILGPPVASLNTVVDQSTFDTLTSNQARHPLDEIRFGATLESVLLGTVAMPADTTPPTPNPMTFAAAPSLATATSATMQAATALDSNFGVEYYFTCTVGGAPDSGWQSSPIYTATGLTPGVSYSYTVKARDLSPALNETAPSAAFSVGAPSTTVVPALANLPQAQAEALITGAGLVVGTVTFAASGTIEAGNVAGQTPSSGTSATPGSAVDLVISSTVQMATVPNLVGLTQAAANSSLAAANLTPGTVLTDYSETIAAGVVMTQNPASGASLTRYAPVQLVVSAGSAAGLAPLTQVLLEDFESPDVNSSVVVNTTVGGALPSNGNWGATGGSNVAGRGIIDKDSGAFNALDPNHQAFAIRSSAAGIVSSFGKIGNITAGTKYTVSVDIVKDSAKNNGTTADFQLKSFDQTATTSTLRDATNEGTVILTRGATAPMSGEFKTVTFEYVATNGDPYLGKDLALRLTGGADGTYAANMDNVRVWTSGARLADTASPWSLTMTPADDASAVAVNSNLTMTFSENVVAGTGYITLKNLTNFSQQLISVTDTKQVSFSGSTLTINPEQNLSELSNYAILIGCDAVRDLGGNPYGGILSTTTWNFTTAASTDSSAPTLTSIVDDRSGTPVDTGNLVTFTVTFNEDMNAQTVTSTDFGNAGSAGLKFMGVTETSPGVFTVLASPTSTGTLQLRINAGSVLTDAAGNPLNTGSALVDNTILTVNLGVAPPVWSSDPVTETNATEDSVYSSTLANNVTDANGDTLIFTKVSGPTWLTVATNGSLSGTPLNSNVGLNTFTVSVTDGNTAPVVATVDITVINTNDAPTFTLNPIYRPAVTRYAAYSSSITQYAQDIDGDTLTFAKTAGPAWLNVAADGTVSGTPAVGDLGTNNFTVSINDGTAAPVTATLIIKVNSADPVLPHIYEPFADTNSSLTGNTPGLGLSGTWTAGASVFVVDSGLNYGATPTSGLTMTLPSTTASVSTGTTLSNAGLLANGATLWFSFLLEVDEGTGTNDGIAMSFGSAAQSGGSGLTMNSSGNGVGISWDRGSIKGSYWSAGTRTSTTTSAGTPKNPTLVVASVTWGADNASNEVLSIYLPGQSLALPASPAITQTIPPLTQSAFNLISFARRGTDGQVDLIDEIRFGSSYDHVTGQATGGSDTTPPTLAGTNIVDNRSGAAIVANNPVTYTVTFSEDMNAATVGTNDFSNAGTSSLTINSVVETSPGVFSVQATPTTAGTLRLQVPAGASLTDVAGNLLNTAAAIIDDTTITVTTQNYPPVWNSNPITEANATEDAAYSSTLSDNASDANGNTLTYTKVSGPAWLTVATNGTLSGTPTNSNVGANSFVVSVSDGIATAVQATLNITVINTNDAPVFLSDPFSGGNATEDLPFSNTIADSATDDDGNTLTYAKVSGPAWLSVAADGTLSGTPGNSNVGSNAFTVSVSDGIAVPDTATLTITVVNTNDLPSWISNPIAGTAATATSPYSGTLAGMASDPDVGATLTYAKVSGPIWLNVAANGTLSGTPSTTEVGENAFTVSVTDGLSTALQATLNINVTAAPATNPLIYETFAQTPGTLNGKTGGIGLAPNTWTALTGSVSVNSPGLSYSTLPTVGGSAYMGANPGANQNSNASINVGTSLSAANMLNNGTTLWFSFLFKPESIVNNKDETFFALGNGGMSSTGTFSAGQSAVGLHIDRNSRVNAAYWNNTMAADSKASGASANTTTLIVGKIVWGATSETISLYLPGADLALPASAFSTLTTPGNLNQSGFNTISWGGETNLNARTFIDDIRFGASYASVVYASAPALSPIGFVDNISGGPAMAGNLITYSIFFSEDIDATTVTAADFGNAGTSAITIGTITETSPGVFTVPVTPTTAGSLQLRVIAGAVITDVGGSALDTTTAIADNTTITVNAGNIAPTWTSNPVNESNATEEAAYTSTLADNASDANSNPLTFAKVSGPAWLNVAANGALSGTPANSNVGANSFTVSVTDSLSTAVQATLNITVINTNDAPTWTANPLTGAAATEDSAYSATLVGSASDVDPGASLTFAKASGPAWLNVATNGTLSGTPTNSNVGLNSFTISVTDGIASAALTTLNITVTNTNDAPTWTSNPVTGTNATEDSAYSASLVGAASDVDAGASLTFAKVSGPAWLSVATNGTLSGTPTNSNVGANSFTISVSDGIATAVQATLNITVGNTNDAPTWTSNPITGTNATEDSAYSATLAASASDVDAGASLTFAKVSGPAWLNVATNGALSGTPANSDVGANSFTVSVSDGVATAVQATLNITVTNTNDAPTWTSNPITGTNATEDSAYSATLAGSATDVDAGASLTFSKISGPAWLSVATNGTLSGTPASSNLGVNSFTVSVSDGIATAVQATLNITVLNINHAPTWTSNPITGTNATEDTAYSTTLAGSASDIDAGASLTFAKVSGPAWLSVATNGALSGTPTNSDVGANSFTVSVSDGIATAVQATLNIAVTNTNDAPTWASNPITGTNATEDSPYSATLTSNASDVDAGASLTFAKVSGPAWLNVATNGALSGTPINSDVGANSFTVSVSDGIAIAVQATLNITVTNTNDAPTWASNPITGTNATEDSAYSTTLDGSASDVDASSSLTFAKVSGPAWLNVAPSGALTGTPTNSDVGANSFTVSVSDGIATAVQATLNITVTNTNDAPTWVANPIAGTSANPGLAYSGSLAGSATDVDAGAALTFAKVSGPAWLTVGTNGALSGTPAIEDAGANSFTVSVSDGITTAVQATLNITVNFPALTWDTDAAGNWTDITNWLGDVAYASGTNATAIFGDFITQNRTITLNAPITIGNIIALDTTHNYTISGANTLTLDRSSGIPTIDVTTPSRTLTLSSEVAGLDGLQKIGMGTLTLTGASSYTGETTITGGSLNLGGVTTTGSLSSTVLNLVSGTLTYTRTGTNTQNFTTTNIKPGASTINTTVATNTLNLGDLTRDVGGTLNFGSTGSILTSEANNTAGIIGGWATFNNANWAVANGASAITGNPTYYTTVDGSTTGANYTNVRNMDVSASVTMDATINPNTVRFNVLGASTVTLAAGDNVIASGGILVTGTVGANASTITGGNLAGSSGGDLIIHQHNTNTGGTLAIGSTIKDNGTATGLTKSGAGTLSLTGNNSYTGVTTINAGTLLISHANALGTTAGNTTIAATGSTSTGGQLQLTGGITCPENITITGSTELSGLAGAILGSANNTVTLSGNITLSNLTGGVRIATSNAGAKMNFIGTISQTGSSQALVFALGNAGGQTVTVNNPIALNGGSLILTGNGSNVILKGVNATDGSGIGTTTINSGGVGLQLGISNAINTTATLTNNGNFDLAGFNQTVNALAGASTGIVKNTVAGTKTLTVGNGGGSGSFSGVIQTGTGNIQLVKTGIGTQTLNGTNTSTGGTRIDSGTLTLGHATNTLADTGAVNVNGGTLDIGTNTDTVGAVTLTSGSITGTTGVLTGSSYALESGSISAILAGPAVDMTKTTAGTVTLSGDNTYAGATNVNDGTLLVNGNQSTASGDVTVAANATLGGTGTLGGNTTIAAGGKLEFNLSSAAASHNSLELVTGKALTFSGASMLTITSTGGASPGTYTLITGGNNIGGATLPTLNLPMGWTATVSISGNSLLLDITSTGGPGPIDHFDISTIASPQTVGTAITGITLTAKDASNVTATSFTGTVTFGGTGGFTGTSANFVSGVLTNVSVTPTAAGSNLTLTVNDGAGHTGSATITTINPAPSPYETWAVGGVAFDADTNGDGVKNGLAWLLGSLNPSQNALSNLPQASRNGTNLRLTFRCLKSTKRGTAQITIQSSSDLGVSDPWANHEAAVPDADGTVNGVIFDTTDDGDFINVIADIPVAGGKLFGRLKATP